MPDPVRSERRVILAGPAEFRARLAGLLEGLGYASSSAEDAPSALALLASAPETDLLVAEVEAAAADGFRLLRGVAGTPDRPPVLVVASPDRLGLVAACSRAGSDDFLVEPVDPRLLFQRVHVLVEDNPRAHRRLACDVPADVTTGAETWTVELREISEGGASLVMDAALEVTDLVRLSFSLPGHREALEVGGQVIYSRPEGGRFRNGVRFVVLCREARAAIAGFTEGEGT